MLRGLPFSNVLGLWSGHSCNSSPGSGPPRSSCSWVSSCSSGPTLFSYEPVWCRCAHEWSARCPGLNAHAREYQMTMTWCMDDLCNYLQGSQHHPKHAIELNIYCIFFYKLSSSITSNSQDASKIHQTQLIPFNLYIYTFYGFLYSFLSPLKITCNSVHQ